MKLHADQRCIILQINSLTTQTDNMTQNLNITVTYARFVTIRCNYRMMLLNQICVYNYGHILVFYCT
jgi:hypothetical protein